MKTFLVFWSLIDSLQDEIKTIILGLATIFILDSHDIFIFHHNLLPKFLFFFISSKRRQTKCNYTRGPSVSHWPEKSRNNLLWFSFMSVCTKTEKSLVYIHNENKRWNELHTEKWKCKSYFQYVWLFTWHSLGGVRVGWVTLGITSATSVIMN